MTNPEKLHTGDGQEFDPVVGVTETGYDHTVMIDGYEIGLNSTSYSKLEGAADSVSLEDE